MGVLRALHQISAITFEDNVVFIAPASKAMIPLAGLSVAANPAPAYRTTLITFACHTEDLGAELSSASFLAALTCIETKRATSTAK